MNGVLVEGRCGIETNEIGVQIVVNGLRKSEKIYICSQRKIVNMMVFPRVFGMWCG